ncbi:formate dehydrogenase accessory sulfurtransferase FdhD [Ignisphaera sp. 4213-co]|uniref:Formate dehydrogenase accessory sulfurtransferase FdhD n=1 Tax=Ignisphaera cupida TaxID=3050454 RepID=A0ABD4Z7T0_9CREN|nr:formate dehydrogenase accessory sulfurtransferase FdhD [Ignisphaera sp. 4213-co]MDK6028623.1 formate dehydrogenase accessory sulfurtransferase FdhD [Ignisphaera sp. 4213-co]
MNIISSSKIVRVNGNSSKELDDFVAEEVEGRIYIDGVEVFRLPTSPHMLEYLGIGYAITHGFDVSESKVIVEGSNVLLFYVKTLTKTMDRCLNTLDVKVKAVDIFKAFNEASEKAKLFKATGCFHFAALFTLEGNLIDIVEDISRVGALLKLIGKAYEAKIDFRKTMVVLSSRAASEMIESIAAMCIPIAVFRGAPTRKSIEIAKKNNITLIAHVRENKLNIYSGFNKIDFSS